ncbi:MAG TPA: GH3 auxin-responsive promoter family protein [Phycisphaerae bacterium]|nr:GH3 auxin-responsive promoter family protein [Phycisphaerae bacterium]
MLSRPTLGDRLMFILARGHARRVYERLVAATARAAELQESLLLRTIRRNADTDFGRALGLNRVSSAAEFRRRVPIMTYEDHRPYIERVKNGEIGAMFGRQQHVRMFALTSGTSDQPKYIPVTDAFLAEYRAGWNAFGIKALLDHPQAFLRGILQISSRMDESRSPCGIPCGAITGLMAATQKRLVRKYYISPRCLAEIDDADAKYYTIMRLAMPRDVAFMIAASPATQLKLARTGAEHAESIIRDIHDGTLRVEAAVPPSVREQLRCRLAADPAAARRLEAILHEHGRLLPKHYWKLGFLANWTGGTMGLYLREFPEYFGDTPVRDIGLLASEGRVSIPVEDGTPAGILNVVGHFFEFIPVECRDRTDPPTYLGHELEPGREYFVLLTTSSGLCRYDLGDLVRCTGFVGQAPLIEFLNKGAHICSMAGEKLTENQVILAMQRAGRDTGLHVPNFVLVPKWGQPPCYLLHVESPPADACDSPRKLAEALEAQLCQVNVEYASKRRTQRLGPVDLKLLTPGTLDRLDRHQASLYRRSNEQYKHKYLYCHPDDALSIDTKEL